jgi:hypothetical protein
MKYEHKQRLVMPQGDQPMDIREAFSRSQRGEEAGIREMQQFAELGSKEAEFMLLEEINKARLNNPDADFKEAFDRVAEAHPELHRAYLNGNGVMRY